MQRLWARAAQIRCTCNCTLCHSPTSALNRRVTSTAIKKPIRFRDVFAVFYSSVLASAAIADISRKEVAKTEWEMLIKEARDDLKALEEQQQARLAAIALRDDDTVQTTYSPQDTWHDVFQWAKWETARRKTMGFQGLKGPPLTLLEGLSTSEIEELMLDTYISRLNSTNGKTLWSSDGNRTLSIKKIKTLEWSIRKLVHRLLLSTLQGPGARQEAHYGEAHVDSQPPPQANLSSDKLREKIDYCEKRLRFLARHTSNKEYWYRFSSPNSPVYSRRAAGAQEVDLLNIEIHRIFESFRRNRAGKDTLVLEICYALLSSYIHPDIHTYNILIIQLLKLKQMDDVAAVITSLRESHTRPNEITLSALLNFYTVTENRGAFIKLLEQMDARRGGLCLAHPAINTSSILAGRYKDITRVEQKPVKISEEEEDFYYERGGYNFRPSGLRPLAEYHATRKVVQGADMTLLNQTVYGAMVHGILKFFGPRQAMNQYSRMVSDGWETSRRMLAAILQYCCDKLEWEDGCIVWQELCNLPEGPNRTTIVWMLELCRGRREYVRFGEILDYCVRRNLIPSTIWQFPRMITRGYIPKLLRAADVLASAKLLAPPITLAWDFFDRSLEALGYRIANTAVDLAATNFDAYRSINGSLGLNVYLRIRELHRESPAASEDKARRKALQGLKERSRRDVERQVSRVEEIPLEDCADLRCGCCDANFTGIEDLHAHLIMCSSPKITEASNVFVLEENAPASKIMESVEPSLAREASPSPRQQLGSSHTSEGVEIGEALPDQGQQLASFCTTEGVEAEFSEHDGLNSTTEIHSNDATTTNTDLVRRTITSDRAAKIEQLRLNESTTISPGDSPLAQLANIELQRLSTQYSAAARMRTRLAMRQPISRDRSRRPTAPKSARTGPNLRLSLSYDDEPQPENDQSTTKSYDIQWTRPVQLRHVFADLPLIREVVTDTNYQRRDASSPRGGGLVIKRVMLAPPRERLEAIA